MDRYRLIVADDERLIRDSLYELIPWEKLGFEIVLLAEDGKQVIDYLEHEQVDVVLSDIQMRESTGLDIAKYIHGGNSKIKVVLLSGYQEFEFAKKAIEYGVKDYLLKPISIAGIEECFTKIKHELNVEKEQQSHQKKLKEDLNSYEKGIIEKLLELVEIGMIKSREEIVLYLSSFGICEKLEKMVCYEARLTTMDFQEYDIMAQDILSNIFIMLGKKYGFYYFSIICEESPDCYRIVGLAEKEIEAGWVEEAILTINEICQMTVQMEEVVNKLPLFAYLEKIQGFHQVAAYKPDSEKDNYNMITTIARQFLLILNMANENEMEETADKIQQIYFESICYMKRKQQISIVENMIQCMTTLLEERYHISLLQEIKRFDYHMETIERYFHRHITMMYEQMHREEAQDSITEQIRQLIVQNITGSVSLKQAAETVFLSPNYFSRIFREQSGENFSEFCIKLKMEKAAELLKQPRYKVYEVSDYLGYRNIKYFYKLFKRVYHCTPSEYREHCI